MDLTVTDLAVVRGGVAVLTGVHFALSAGSALVLRGPNGIGKTTLLRTVAGLQRPLAGAVSAPAEAIAYAAHADGLKATLTVTDSQALAARAVDHVIVVVQAGKSTRPELAETLERLSAVGKRPAGIVLTRSTRSTTHYGYGYKHDVAGATTPPAPTPMGSQVGR